LSLVPDIDWRFSVNGGREESNVGTPAKQGYSNYGAGLQWTPSPRTRLVLQADERYFGRSHSATFEYANGVLENSATT